jgi:aminomethyltransferase
MRTSSLKNIYAAAGASFGERYGVEVALKVKDLKTEYGYIRDAVGVTDFSHMQMYSVPEDTGLDFLDSIMAGNVARIRFGRILHTFLPDQDGMIAADCYIANGDNELIVLCESIIDDAAVDAIMTADASAGVEKLTGKQAIISVDGYKSWAVVKELFGADVLGLPYLSIENYSFENNPVRLFRAGKTSEFGYILTIDAAAGQSLLKKLAELAQKQGGGLCGVAIHNELRLEGRFFNVYAEGARVKDPLPLGLQWMIDFDKETFTGSSALFERRKSGLTKKIIGVSSSDTVALNVGDQIVSGNRNVATVQSTCFSHVLNKNLGLALFDTDVAFSGLTFNLKQSGGTEITTISMPPIMPKSLSVKLDEI